MGGAFSWVDPYTPYPKTKMSEQLILTLPIGSVSNELELASVSLASKPDTGPWHGLLDPSQWCKSMSFGNTMSWSTRTMNL